MFPVGSETELKIGRTLVAFTGQDVVPVRTMVSQNDAEAAAVPTEMTNDITMSTDELAALTVDSVR